MRISDLHACINRLKEEMPVTFIECLHKNYFVFTENDLLRILQQYTTYKENTFFKYLNTKEETEQVMRELKSAKTDHARFEIAQKFIIVNPNRDFAYLLRKFLYDLITNTICNSSILKAKAQNKLDLQLLEAVKGNNIANCLSLINQGANLHAQDQHGFSVLHIATSVSMVEWLLKRGADLNLTLNYKNSDYDHRGFTPLHWHVLSRSHEIVQCLLANGANPNAKTLLNVNPLFLATKKRGFSPDEPLTILLAEHGSNIRARNNKGHFAMGCPKRHVADQFSEISRRSEELLGMQAAHGAAAWNNIPILSNRIDLAENEQHRLEEELDASQREMIQLEQSIQQLELKIVSLQKLMPNSGNISSIPAQLSTERSNTRPQKILSQTDDEDDDLLYVDSAKKDIIPNNFFPK